MEEIDLSGHRVLVTGGTGFIGGRLVEGIFEETEVKPRVLVRDFSSAARIARFPVEMVAGDITRLVDVEKAVRGCDVVFHCAYGNRGSNKLRRLVNVQGTRNVLEASLREGVRRVIHVSTVSVYGNPREGDLNETARRRYSGDVYADSKLDAEEIAFRYAKRRGLPVTIVQPTIVYGPFAPAWTVHVLNQLKSGRVILIDGGEGLCNAVYIDDVVSSLLLCARKDRAVGEAFLISADRPVRWKDFFGAFERMLGESRTVTLSETEAKKYLRRPQILRAPGIQDAGRLLSPWMADGVRRQVQGALAGLQRGLQKGPLDGQGIHRLDKFTFKLYRSRARVVIDKARKVLGYRPSFDLESGMRRTEQWALWANLLTKERPVPHTRDDLVNRVMREDNL